MESARQPAYHLGGCIQGQPPTGQSGHGHTVGLADDSHYLRFGSGGPVLRQSAHQGRGTPGLRIGLSNRVDKNPFARRRHVLELLSSFADHRVPADGHHSGLTRAIGNPPDVRQQGTRSDLRRRTIAALECELALGGSARATPTCMQPFGKTRLLRVGLHTVSRTGFRRTCFRSARR